MRLAGLIVAALLITACNKPRYAEPMTPPSAYLHLSDKLKAFLQINGLPGSVPCMETDEQSLVPVPVQAVRCWRLEPSRRWRGLYFLGPDARFFCAAPAKECPSPDGSNLSWLEFSTRQQWPRHGGLVALDFIGRHTRYHSDGKRMDGILVEKVISARLLKQPTMRSSEGGSRLEAGMTD